MKTNDLVQYNGESWGQPVSVRGRVIKIDQDDVTIQPLILSWENPIKPIVFKARQLVKIEEK